MRSAQGSVNNSITLLHTRGRASGLDRHDASQLNRNSNFTDNILTSANHIGAQVGFERPVLRSPAASAVGSKDTSYAQISVITFPATSVNR